MNRAITILLALGALAANPVAAQTLLWSDEFDDGTQPDPAVWSYDLGDWGWGNRELQEYTSSPDNARVENGHLVITAREVPWGDGRTLLTSARVRTEDKVTFRYGTVEARIRMANLADGLWPAFWTLGNNFGEVGWPRCGEIDVVEMGSAAAIRDGVVNRRVGSTAHWESNDVKVDYGRWIDATEDLDDDFHLFRMDWTPTSITTWLDDRMVWTIRIDLDTCADCEEFHQPHFLILNMAIGGNYTGILSPAGITAPMPAEMHVDYVRIYDNGFTELGGSAIPLDFGGTSPAHSGSWYNPEQSGHGFSVEFGLGGDEPYAVVYWYVYDDAGNPIFMQGEGRPEGNRLEVDFISPVGMDYGSFDPAAVERQPGGRGVFVFSDSENATFSYTPSEFSQATWGHAAPVENLPLVKLFSVTGGSAAADQ